MAMQKTKKANPMCISIRDIAPLMPTDGSVRHIEFNRDGTIKSVDPPLTPEEMEAAAKMEEGVEGVLTDLFYDIQGVFEQTFAGAELSDEEESECRIAASLEALGMALSDKADNKSRQLACKKIREEISDMLDELEEERWCADCGAEGESIDPMEKETVWLCRKCYTQRAERERAIAEANSANQGDQRPH